MPHDSPASLLLEQAAKITPFFSPILHTIVTIPEKHIVSQFVLDGGWGNAQVALSPNGCFVSCIRSDTDITKEAFEGLRFSCFWDVQQDRWLTHLPDVSRRARDWGLTFFNDQVFACQFQQSATSDEFNLLDITTGQFLDQLRGISVNYFAMKQVMKDDDGNWWYLKHSDNKSGMSYSLKRIRNSSEVETIDKHSWDHAEEVGVALTQGLQSIVPRNGETPLSQFIKARVGNSAFYRTLQPWLIRPSTSIYDWKTGQTWPGWTGAHRWYLSKNGEYLSVVFGKWDKNQLVEQYLAQVFRMPLVFYSPWWSRMAGIVTAVLFFVLFWRWQSKRLLKPNA